MPEPRTSEFRLMCRWAGKRRQCSENNCSVKGTFFPKKLPVSDVPTQYPTTASSLKAQNKNPSSERIVYLPTNLSKNRVRAMSVGNSVAEEVLQKIPSRSCFWLSESSDQCDFVMEISLMGSTLSQTVFKRKSRIFQWESGVVPKFLTGVSCRYGCPTCWDCVRFSTSKNGLQRLRASGESMGIAI